MFKSLISSWFMPTKAAIFSHPKGRRPRYQGLPWVHHGRVGSFQDRGQWRRAQLSLGSPSLFPALQTCWFKPPPVGEPTLVTCYRCSSVSGPREGLPSLFPPPCYPLCSLLLLDTVHIYAPVPLHGHFSVPRVLFSSQVFKPFPWPHDDRSVCWALGAPRTHLCMSVDILWFPLSMTLHIPWGQGPRPLDLFAWPSTAPANRKCPAAFATKKVWPRTWNLMDLGGSPGSAASLQCNRWEPCPRPSMRDRGWQVLASVSGCDDKFRSFLKNI